MERKELDRDVADGTWHAEVRGEEMAQLGVLLQLGGRENLAAHATLTPGQKETFKLKILSSLEKTNFLFDF